MTRELPEILRKYFGDLAGPPVEHWPECRQREILAADLRNIKPPGPYLIHRGFDLRDLRMACVERPSSHNDNRDIDEPCDGNGFAPVLPDTISH